MITKERLEELIKEKAKVYFIYNESFIAGYSSIVKIKELDLSDFKPIYFTSSNIENDFVAIKSANSTINRNDFENLFETKEEAEWELKFRNISRTETLNLPTWKKIKRKPTIISFMSKDYKLCKLCLGEIVAVIGNGTKSSKKKYVCVRIDKDDHYFERTEKGYIEACKLCKKLFLGEEI